MELAVVGLVCRFILQNYIAQLAVEWVIQFVFIVQEASSCRLHTPRAGVLTVSLSLNTRAYAVRVGSESILRAS